MYQDKYLIILFDRDYRLLFNFCIVVVIRFVLLYIQLGVLILNSIDCNNFEQLIVKHLPHRRLNDNKFQAFTPVISGKSK